MGRNKKPSLMFYTILDKIYLGGPMQDVKRLKRLTAELFMELNKFDASNRVVRRFSFVVPDRDDLFCVVEQLADGSFVTRFRKMKKVGSHLK